MATISKKGKNPLSSIILGVFLLIAGIGLININIVAATAIGFFGVIILANNA